MEIIKSIGKLFKKAKAKILSVGAPAEEEVDYNRVVQREVPKESAEKPTVVAAIDKVEHEEDIEFGKGTETPPPKMPAKEKAVSKKTAVKKSETKTTSAKKPSPKKTTEKKTTSDKKTASKKSTPKKASAKTSTVKTEAKKSTEKKTSKKAAGTKKSEKLALYAKDIKKHYGKVDSDFLEIIVKNLGSSIYKKDAELVSCSDPKELDTVRKNFLMKKLSIDASQKVLDAAIQDVCEELKETKIKYRATFYYSLAKKFKKESVLS